MCLDGTEENCMKRRILSQRNDFKWQILTRNGFNEKQIREIEAGIDLNLDVSLYAFTCFDADQMYQIRRGLEEGINVFEYLDPSIPFYIMSSIRDILLKAD